METADVKFHLDVFEGPLDLLLHLIKTNELEISEISISKITSQYLDYLRLMESMDLEVAGDYLVMAASLINIKLRALLPSPEEEVEEEGEELDDFMSAKRLMHRLIEYRRFKEAAQTLGRQAESQARTFMREVALPKLADAESDSGVQGDLSLLLSAFARVIRFVDRRDYHEVQSEEFTIDEKIVFLRRRLVVEERIRLSTLFENCRSKVEAVVLLLAALELCRLKELRVIQGDCFDEALLIPRRADGESDEARDAIAGEARAAEAAEAEILANRTGVVDDGANSIEEDAEEAEVEAALAGIEIAPQSHNPFESPSNEFGEDGNDDADGELDGDENSPAAQIIDMTPDGGPAGPDEDA